jgi:hypothetical protein
LTSTSSSRSTTYADTRSGTRCFEPSRSGSQGASGRAIMPPEPGGDEFVLVLVDADDEVATEVVERIEVDVLATAIPSAAPERPSLNGGSGHSSRGLRVVARRLARKVRANGSPAGPP